MKIELKHRFPSSGIFRRLFIALLFAVSISMLLITPAFAQKVISLSLEEAVRMAREASPSALSAKHAFRNSYWSWRSYKANYLPLLTLSSSPALNRSIRLITQPDGRETYHKQDQLNTNASLRLNQHIPLTGGSLYMHSQLSRIDLFSTHSVDYMSSPLIIGYSQSLFGYNSFKWDRQIEPLRYEQAKKSYIETCEDIAQSTVAYFYALAAAQSALEVARENHRHAERNYQIGEGRYQVGTIAEEEMMQLEISLLTQETAMLNAQISVDDHIRLLRNYLGITEEADIQLLHDEVVPQYKVDEERAYLLALENNSQVFRFRIRETESESNIAHARSNRGFQADLSLEFGLMQNANRLADAYKKPGQSQVVQITLSIPLLDWGRGKGRVKMAESQRDQMQLQLQQDKSDFRLNIIKTVRQFNLQHDQVVIARKRREIADRRHAIAQRQYQLGKMGTLELDQAINEKDNARANWVNALRSYWDLHYEIRILTAYDFLQNHLLTADYEEIIK